MKKINLNTIRIDGGTQPRERINMEVVADYAEAVKVGIEFPPVVVFFDGAEHWLADGFHRYHAHKQAGKASILADVREGTLLDAKLLAVGANSGHGLRRTNEDKRRAVQMVLDEPAWSHWSDRDIAEACGVSAPFVAGIRRPPKKQATTCGSEPAPVDKRKPFTPQQEGGDSTPVKKTTLPPAPAPAERGQTLPPADDDGPSDEELAAAERETAEELEALRRIAMADDKMAAVLAENKQLRAEVRVLKERRDGLMNENAELVKRIKALQRKLDKVEHA